MTKISGTAFLVNYLRSKDVKLSGDVYSYLWIEKGSSELAEEWQREFNPLQTYQLCLRHRFFLEWVKKAIALGIERVINIGAGFTTYTHLVEPSIPALEIDYRHITEYKAARLKEFEEKGLIPHRDITFLSIDLNSGSDLNKMEGHLKKWVCGERSLAILESVTYYLNKSSVDEIFKTLDKIQAKGSLVATNYLEPSSLNNSIFKKWIPFAKKNYGIDPSGHTFLEKKYYERFKGYRVVDSSSFFELEKRFTKGALIRKDCDNVFPEDFVILEKIYA